MKRLALFIFALLLAVPTMATEERRLTVGDSQLLRLDANTQIMVGDDEVLAVRLVNPKQLMVKALSAGYTDLWLLGTDKRRLRFTVIEPPSDKLQLQLSNLQQTDSALQVVPNGSFVLTQGEVSVATKQRLSELAVQFPQLLEQTRTQAVDAPMLRLSVKIIEIKKQFIQELGIRWQSSTSGPSLVQGSQGIVSWTAQLDSTLNLMQQRGQAELLASPTLSAQSGQSASFLAGGELPIPQVLSQGMQDVSFREYGIKLNIAPQVTATGRIKTEMSAEVSNIDPAVTVGGVPGILSRRTDSIFLANEGDTLVLSGLISQQQSYNSAEVPGSENVPLLGQLLQSKQQREEQTELVILVTTERLDAVEQRHQLTQQHRQQQQQWLITAGCSGLRED